MPFMGGYTDNSGLKKEVERLNNTLEERLKRKSLSEEQTKDVLHTVKILLEKIEKMEDMQRKIALTVFDLHESGKMNDEVFQNLKEYFKPFYDEPYKQDDY